MQSKYYILSAIMYGLTLYSYTTIWPIIPIILLVQIIYAAYYKKIRLDKYSIISAGIVALSALPLLLFLLVNKGIIKDIKTPILSIPKLLYMWENEISFDGFFHQMQNLVFIIFKQSDGLPWNATESFGLFYKFSLPFSIIGLIYMIYIIIKKFRQKECNGTIFLLVNLIFSIFLGYLIKININRINSICIPIIFCIIFGLLACGNIIWILRQFDLI